MKKRFSTSDFIKAKRNNKKISMVTAYDRLTASLAEQAQVDAVLVGDSLGMVVLGYDDTLKVTMEDMVRHTKSVANSSENCMIVADMPFLSYGITIEQSIENAGRLMREGGAGSVKLEGGVGVEDTISSIVNVGIPVMGHIGYTPQSVHVFGGHKSQGKDMNTAKKVMEDALAVERGGAFAVVLECVPYKVAELISEKLSIPTIGIGSGAECDGQILVIHDLLGLSGDFKPRHCKRYIEGEAILADAVSQYVKEMRDQSFPKEENSFKVEESALEMLKRDYF